MKNRRDLLIIIGLFLALILFVALGPRRQQTQAGVDAPTTYSDQDAGALALYRWIGALGYDARRLEYRPFELGEEDAALVMLNPSEPVTRPQARDTLAWVERGGTLILADDTPALFGAPNALLTELKVEVAVYSDTATIVQADPDQPALDQPPMGVADVRAGRVLVPRRDDYVTLVGAPDAILVAGIKLGRGYVYVSSTSRPFTNAGLRDPEHAALVLNLLRRVPPGGRVLFDEIHHGFATPPQASGVLLSSPWGWAATYALIATALYLVLSGRRFGRPVPLPESVERRSSAEYVESMADLFLRGGKRGYIQRHYLTAFKRRLARPYAINPQLDDEAFVAELARARAVDTPALRGLLARLRAEPAGEAEFVRTVAEAEATATMFEQSRG